MLGLVRFKRFFLRIFIVQFVIWLLYFVSKSYSVTETPKSRESEQNSHLKPNATVLLNNRGRPNKWTFADNYTKYTVEHFGLNELTSVVALQPELGPVINDVLSFQYEINNEEICQRFGNANLTLLAVVVSTINHLERRHLIRKTWARTLTDSKSFGERWAQIVFLIGSSDQTTQELIVNESRQYKDIIQLNIVDHYSNLTLKSVALLHWATNYCPQAQFILKSDDDVFINVQQLIDKIRKMSPRNIYGSGTKGDKPKREEGNKYFVSNDVWPWPTYPVYLFGGAYVLGKDTLGPLLAAAQTTPLFTYEDVYLTGICTLKAGVDVFVSDKMYRRFYPKILDPCFVRSAAMWQTQSVDQFLESQNQTSRIYARNIPCKTVEYTLF